MASSRRTSCTNSTFLHFILFRCKSVERFFSFRCFHFHRAIEWKYRSSDEWKDEVYEEKMHWILNVWHGATEMRFIRVRNNYCIWFSILNGKTTPLKRPLKRWNRCANTMPKSRADAKHSVTKVHVTHAQHTLRILSHCPMSVLRTQFWRCFFSFVKCTPIFFYSFLILILPDERVT